MTTRELRQALFHLNDQKMTVEQLRSMLFGIADQDAELEIGFGMFKEAENKLAAQVEKQKQIDAL